MLRTVVLLLLRREIFRFDTANHSTASETCYAALWQLPRPDFHRLANSSFQGTPYRTITNDAHLSDAARRYLETTADNLIRRASTIGSYVRQVAENLLADKKQVRIRSVLGILNLSKKYPGHDVDKAAARALLYQNPNYQYMKKILERGLQNQTEGQLLMFPATHFARPKDYWQSGVEVPVVSNGAPGIEP